MESVYSAGKLVGEDTATDTTAKKEGGEVSQGTGTGEMVFDEWQKEVIGFEGSVTIRAGRQVGKSTTVGKRSAELMMKYDNSSSLIIAPSQRQSSQLFIKTLSWLAEAHQAAIDKAGGYKENLEVSLRRNDELKRVFEQKHGIYAERPTKTMVKLKNGSICYSLPAGKTGIYLRTFALDFLYIDEAAYVPDAVYTALKPMLAVSVQTKKLGWEVFLSTPFGKGGFFYDSHYSTDYKQYHINSEKCVRIPKEFLLKEKKRLSRIEYAQEYLGEFIDEFHQFFPTKLIKSRMTFLRWDYETDYKPGLRYFLGVDIARYGEDENAFVIAEMQTNGNLKIVKAFTTARKSLVDTFNRIMKMNESYDFNRILIDDSGIGAGVTDMLIEKLRRKVLGLGNARKTVDAEAQQKSKIFKEDLYSNAAVMMEKEPPAIEIINSLKLLKSLKSMTFEYTQEKNLRIYGRYSHLAEAFVRACWSVKAKSLKLFIA